MKKNVFILIIGLLVLISLITGIYIGRNVNSTNGQIIDTQTSYSVVEVNTEMAEYVRIEYENGKNSWNIEITDAIKGKEENPYFFPKDLHTAKYNIRSNLDMLETKHEIELMIIPVESSESGTIYELRLDCDEEFRGRNYYGWDRCSLGYFYVQDDKIYYIGHLYIGQLYTGKEIASIISEEGLMEKGVVVCQEEGLEDPLSEDEKGWHEYLLADGNRREYHGYNNLVETGYYENFIWEKGKGLVEYVSGWGAERDSINLSLIQEEDD